MGGPWARRCEAGPVPVVFPPGIAEVMTSQSQAKVETGAGEQGEAQVPLRGPWARRTMYSLVIKALQNGSS